MPATTGSTAAVVLAGGIGVRMAAGTGAATDATVATDRPAEPTATTEPSAALTDPTAVLPKQLLMLAGTTVLEHSVGAFARAPGIDAVFVLMAADFVARAQDIVDRAGFERVRPVRAGGATRSGSTRIALDLLGDEFDTVLFHDAARPLVEPGTIAACLRALGEADAVSVAVEPSDTVVVIDGARITAVPPRDRLRQLQTPQGFRVTTIRRAHALAAADRDFSATDDCGIVLRYLPDVAIHIVDGSPRNLKITHPGDLVVAQALYGIDPATGAARAD